MPDRWNRAPLGRSHALLGAATLAIVLLLGIAGTITTGGDDDGADSDTSAPPASSPEGRVLEHSAIGATIRRPRRWTHRRARRLLSLRSPDRTVIMSVSLPPGTDRSAAILRSGVSVVRTQYRDVRVVGVDRGRVADLPTNSVIMSAANSRGVRLRILTSAPQGRARAWLVQVFSAAGAEEKRLAEAQAAIGTLRLSG